MSPSISSDGRELYFADYRPPTSGPFRDIWVTYFTGLSYQNLPQIGRPLLYHITDAARPGDRYQIGLSLSNRVGVAVPGVGRIPLDLDPLLVSSVNGQPATVFSNFGGRLDSRGEATATLTIPNLGPAVGVVLHAAAVLFDGQGQLDYISNPVVLGVHR